MPAKGSLVAKDAAAEVPSGMVAMLAFVGGYYSCRVFRGPLHPLLDCAFAIRATIVAPAFVLTKEKSKEVNAILKAICLKLVCNLQVFSTFDEPVAHCGKSVENFPAAYVVIRNSL